MAQQRVLLIAEAANPDWTSVPLVGWSCARALFEVTDAHLVTQVRNAEAIERRGFRQGVEFTALDSEAVARQMWRTNVAIRKLTGLGWTFETMMNVLPYYYFEQLLWRRFGREIEAGRWDVVHRITPLSPTIPSIIAQRCERVGVPFVCGPLNGGVPWPSGFGKAQRQEGEWLHYVRGAYKLLPGYRQTQAHAGALIAGSLDTLSQLSPSAQARAVYLPENAVDELRFKAKSMGTVSLPLRVAFVGRLVPYKGADMLIEAAAELVKSGKVMLDIIGDGPERPQLAALIERLGLQSGVRLEGWVEHHHLPARLAESDVFGFPSVREFGGAVVLEAMALGLVPVVADYGGPAELVTERTGIKLALGSRAELILGMRRALEGLVNDPGKIRTMGERARQRVLHHYTWKAKARQIQEIYLWARKLADKPDFGRPLPDVQQPQPVYEVPTARESIIA